MAQDYIAILSMQTGIQLFNKAMILFLKEYSGVIPFQVTHFESLLIWDALSGIVQAQSCRSKRGRQLDSQLWYGTVIASVKSCLVPSGRKILFSPLLSNNGEKKSPPQATGRPNVTDPHSRYLVSILRSPAMRSMGNLGSAELSTE